MYQGKFDAKKKKTGVDIHDVVVQRNSASAKKNASATPQAAAQKTAPVQKAAPSKKQPAPKSVPEKNTKKKGPRLGGVIFYTLYFMSILVFFVGVFFGLQFLQDWLVDFQAAQPTLKCEQVFAELFSDPDWSALYDAAGIEDTAYEGKEEFVAYMEKTIGDTELTYLETSAGLAKDKKKYNVLLDEKKIATFTLVDKNGAEAVTDIPDWQLGSIELFFNREESYQIINLDGHTVYVNDVPLDESYIIQIASTKAEEYLPIGTTGIRMCTQEISGLMAIPTVSIRNENGEEMEVSYDEATHTFTEQTESNTIGEEEKEVALNAVKTYALYTIEQASATDVAKYFDRSSDTYNTIIKVERGYTQDHNGYRFADEVVSDYYRYSDNLFSVRISMSLNITRTDGTVKQTPIAESLFFEKNANGKWLCFEMTGVDVSQPVGKVRLTFMNDGNVLQTGFHETDASELSCPLVSVPEGKVFSGWVREDVAENGSKTLTVIFTPEENGHVKLPVNSSLEPMTLYALFEDAAEATTTETEGA